MSWHYYITDDRSSMKVWDHTQDPAVDDPLTTLQNDGSGFTLPDDVLAVMDSEAEPEMPSQAPSVTARGAALLRHMSRQDIEEYES